MQTLKAQDWYQHQRLMQSVYAVFVRYTNDWRWSKIESILLLSDVEKLERAKFQTDEFDLICAILVLMFPCFPFYRSTDDTWYYNET